MLKTKRYEYFPFEKIRIHPDIINHRRLDFRKVDHYEKDILQNGLIEPLVIWETEGGEHYLVGGFHRTSAIRAIRDKHPGYFDYVDVRMVSGAFDDIMALNLKLNSDRLDAKPVEFFDTVIHLHEAGWSNEKIADFLDRKKGWVDEIIQYVPSMDLRLKRMLSRGKVTWAKARSICKLAEKAGGQSGDVFDQAILDMGKKKKARPRSPLTAGAVKHKLNSELKKDQTRVHILTSHDLYAFVRLIEGRSFTDEDVEKVRTKLPHLFEKEPGTEPLKPST